jgi:hypothetical protein
MPDQERYVGKCGCGGVYDVPIPEGQERANAWKRRHENAGHTPRGETYIQRIGIDRDPRR